MSPLILVLVLSLGLCNAADLQSGIQGRIVGGKLAVAGQYPYAAAIFAQKPGASYFYAGTLISRTYVLTAAQVVHDGILFIVHLGSIRLNATDSNRVVAQSAEYIIHENYNPQTLENDIGLIVFRIPITENDYLHPVSFKSPSDLPAGVLVRAMGWGATSDQSSLQSENLYYVDVAVLSNLECRRIYGNQIKDQMACVAGNNNEGTCHGDMGGPLVHIVGNEHKVVGVASFVSGLGCQQGHPSGFTRVFHYEQWISQKTGINL